MHTELLQELGLSLNEAQIYEALLTYGGSGVSTISLRSGVHRRNAYDCLHRLLEKGLVYEVFSEKETVYEAVDPEKLMEIVKEKEERLCAALPDFLKVFEKHKTSQRAYIYQGIEGIKNYQRVALQQKEDIYSFAAKGAWFDPRLDTKHFIKECEKRNMKHHQIYDFNVKQHLPDMPDSLGGEYKFLPEKFQTISTIDIFGDHVITYTGLTFGKLEDDSKIFVMISPDLAESYRTWWRMVWELLP